MTTPEEQQIGQLALSLKFVEPQQLSQCVVQQTQLSQQGKQLSIVEVMVQQGYLTLSQVEILRRQCLEQTDYLSQITNKKILKQFGRYKIIEKIGQGGMGCVYKVFDPHLDRYIALKVLLGENEISIKRFFREAKATARLQHPNIVRVYDMGSEDGEPFFTMDFIVGTSLKSMVKTGVGPKKIAKIVKKICYAAEYAHEQGIIHRDLKPENIMLDNKNEPKIMDFGLAKVEGGHQLSQSGAVLGTFQYMSPEQAQGRHRDVDKRSDIYSLGVIIYELLTGRKPFAGNTIYQVLNQVLEKDPLPPCKIKPRIPKSMEYICLKAMAKKKEDRYQSAKELAEDLSLFLDGKKPGVKAKPYRLWIGVAILFAVVVGIALFGQNKKLPKLKNIKLSSKEKSVQKSFSKSKIDSSAASQKSSSKAIKRKNAPHRLHFHIEQLQLENKTRNIRQYFTWEGKLRRVYEKGNKQKTQKMANNAANWNRKANALRGEILSLQKMPFKSAKTLWRLANCAIEARMYVHARYYLNEIQWKFAQSSFYAKAQKKQQYVFDQLRMHSKQVPPVRRLVWQILREIAYARVLSIEQKFKTGIDHFEQAQELAQQGAELFSLEIELVQHLTQKTISQQLQKLFTQKGFALSNRAVLKKSAPGWIISDKWENQYAIKKVELENKQVLKVYAPLWEFIPWIKSMQAIFYIRLLDFATAQKVLKTAHLKHKTFWYSSLSWYLPRRSFIWPEITLARAILYFFQGKYKEAQALFAKLKKNYHFYVSADKELLWIIKPYLKDNTLKQNQTKRQKRLEVHIQKLFSMFLVRGIINGKRSSKTLQVFEDLLNLEMAPYMINNHLGDINFRLNKGQKAIDHYLVSWRLYPESLVMYSLGYLAMKRGYKKEAIKCFEYVYKNPPDKVDAKKTRFQIKRILAQLKK